MSPSKINQDKGIRPCAKELSTLARSPETDEHSRELARESVVDERNKILFIPFNNYSLVENSPY